MIMKRKLLKQIFKEWRTNVWLATELLVVSVICWYLVDTEYVTTSVRNEPKGFDTSHCYRIYFDILNENSSEYVDMGPMAEENMGHIVEVLSDQFYKMYDRIENRPEIEAIGMGRNAFHYNGSNNVCNLYIDSIHRNSGWVIERMVTPGFLRVFRYHGVDGETPEKLAEILEREPQAMFVSENMFNMVPDGSSIHDFLGQRATIRDDLSMIVRAVLVTPRYSDYHPAARSYSIVRGASREEVPFMNEMVVRVKDNMDDNFIENFLRDSEEINEGNYFISGVDSFDDIRDSYQSGKEIEQRNQRIIFIFLAINVFLGVFGTFWFRTQQRVHEIAVRKAHGATSIGVLRRLITEGLLLLVLVTPLALVADWILIHFELVKYYMDGFTDPVRFAVCTLISFGMLAVMITLGILIPALRAMRLSPARALAEE